MPTGDAVTRCQNFVVGIGPPRRRQPPQSVAGRNRKRCLAADFFAGTHATPAMRRVATGIFDHLKHGSAADQPAVIRLNSMFGGGRPTR